MGRPPTMKKSATIRDVAREAKVSIAAVSYALNGGGTIGEEVRARVRDVAQQLGYRPNRSAQAVRTGKSMTLGLVVPDLNNPYYPALAQSFERAARQAGYTVVLIDTSGHVEEEVQGIHRLEQHGVEGIVWCQTAGPDEAVSSDYSVPIVIIGTPSLSIDNVTTKDYEGGQLLGRHLLEMGHGRIGMLTAAGVPPSKDDRRLGFLAALEGHATVTWEEKTPFAIDLPERILTALERRDVSAVMCGNDLIAVGVLRAARQLGITVPAELSVVGFDDIPWASIVEPELTTVRQPVSEMAAVALTLLLDRIAEPTRAVRHFKVGVELIKRQSVAEAPVSWGWRRIGRS